MERQGEREVRKKRAKIDIEKQRKGLGRDNRRENSKQHENGKGNL